MLWSPVALRLCGPGLDVRAVQAALSVSVALVGARQPLGPIVTLLGNATSARAVSHVWARMRATGSWSTTQQAVIRIADYLHGHHTPIDYQRRRALDYVELLPVASWHQICRTTDSPAGRPAAITLARTALFSRLTGCPAEQAPWFTPTPGFRGQLTRFSTQTTELLRHQLDSIAVEFLADHDITEPLLWAPPASLFSDLALPGLDPDSIDVNRLHQLLTQPGTTVAGAARQLQVTPDAVRYLTEVHPCPPVPPPLGRNRMRRIAGLTPATLARMHSDKEHSLTALARHCDMSRQTLTRIATTFGVDTRSPGRTRTSRRDREWLVQHYLTEHRTLNEIAGLAGVSASTVTRWLRHYDIPTRPRGARSHANAGAARRAAPTQQALLEPALREALGWERLQRFSIAMQHPTLAAAAQTLNTSEAVLSKQFRRLEAELGGALYHRALRGRPMRPNGFGRKVLTAISKQGRSALTVWEVGDADSNVDALRGASQSANNQV
jgi:transposase-like protein